MMGFRRPEYGLENREVFDVLRLAACQFGADGALADKGLQGLIEGLHTVGLTGLEGGVDLGDFVLADEVAHGRCRNQDLVCGDTAVAVAGFQQGLGNDGAQGFGQHGAHDFFSPAGNTSTIRSMVLAAPVVCSVPKTK